MFLQKNSKVRGVFLFLLKLLQMNKIIIFSAPSGAGKTTIVKELLKLQELALSFSISACSRKKREHETHGVDYYFLSADEFKTKIANNEFVEWQEVYTDSFYGTLKSEIDRIFSAGCNVLFDVDVYGGMNLKKIFGSQALSIFVQPPSIEELENRLRNRKTETEETIAKRIAKAKEEMSQAQNFDKILINDNLEVAVADAIKMVKEFLNN